MTPDLEKKVRDAFRQFKDSKKTETDIQPLMVILDRIFGSGHYSVNPATITNAMEHLNGYCISVQDNNIFFPKPSVFKIKDNTFISWGELLNEAETILPAYFSFGEIIPIVSAIHAADNQSEKIKRGNEALGKLFPPQTLALLSVDLYPKFSALSDSNVQIRETVEAYCLGHYRSAITTLLPCIEHAIKALGARLGIAEQENISSNFLLEIINKSLKNYISDYVYRDYDWFPQNIGNDDFFNKFDERYQIIANGRDYIKNHLYQNTGKYTGISQLNRHSILHGFMTKYHDQPNYLRLINLLNNICFMLTISGEAVSLMLREGTDSCLAFYRHLLCLERVGSARAKYLDKHGIHR
ncbi:hypothetical protein [Yersinia enterocolitica]|uniref:hypothetical protein n=1 Tax=Yersinia enterocolitica TaxID=630 RepID=UPI003D02A889